MDLSPTQWIQLITTTGAAGVLAVVLAAFATDRWCTTKSADRRVQAATEAKDAQLRAVTEAKDKEIAELRQTQQQAWQLAERNAGSQEAMVKILAGAVSRLALPSPPSDPPATRPLRRPRGQP